MRIFIAIVCALMGLTNDISRQDQNDHSPLIVTAI